jgi:hypothetical protein
MGQYWKVVNLDKHEYLDQYKLGAGAKLWEQLASHPGTGAALIILCAAMPEARGGGDLDMVGPNWHGVERETASNDPPQLTESYMAIAKRAIGRWAGDRIAIVGDYAEDTDLGQAWQASTIYNKCHEGQNGEPSEWLDITDDVAKVIEHELNGKFKGEGWKDWKPTRVRKARKA